MGVLIKTSTRDTREGRGERRQQQKNGFGSVLCVCALEHERQAVAVVVWGWDEWFV